ncbi:MAG TPA: HNH endonuclease [Frankiaceae bacterium]|nr:HNH endonuclease [Frankiaceae bacterium]
MFDRGAAAFAAVAPEAPIGLYACPLCLRGFTRDETAPGRALTIEHVPPQGLGGREMCLTCRGCNSISGSALDAHMERHRTFVDFLAGVDTRDIRATFTVEGRQQRGVVRCENGAYVLGGVLARDRPGIAAAMIDHLDQIVAEKATDWSLGITFEDPWQQRRVNIGWLRAGYLAAFAALGYRYIAQPAFSAVRQQILRPDDDVVRLTVMLARGDAPHTTRSILLVEKPSELRSVVVQMGRAVVLLPYIGCSAGAEIFTDLPLADAGSTDLHGQLLPWPDRAAFLLDT